MTEIKKSKLSPDLEQASKQLDAFEDSVKTMTMDRMNTAPKQEVEQQTKLSKQEIEKAKGIYLKPLRSINNKDKFNENFRSEYNQAKEYVHFIAENKEIIGEPINLWTRPFGGVPAEYWEVPTNKPVWGPRYLAEQIKRASYHKLVMQQNNVIGGDYAGQYYGSMAVDTTVQRLDAIPVSDNKSVFMGSNKF
jgi:hypothetical protein